MNMAAIACLYLSYYKFHVQGNLRQGKPDNLRSDFLNAYASEKLTKASVFVLIRALTCHTQQGIESAFRRLSRHRICAIPHPAKAVCPLALASFLLPWYNSLTMSKRKQRDVEAQKER